MATMNIFSEANKAWDTTELTDLINEMPNLPQMIGSMNLFTPKPVKQKNIMIDKEKGVLNLIGFSERGGDLTGHKRGSRETVNFEIPKLGTTDKISAETVDGLRASGSDSELMVVKTEVEKRLLEMRNNLAYSDEYLQLAAIQGKVLDPADGSEYVNYFTSFGITPKANVSFELDVETTLVKQIAEELVIDMKRTAQGAWVQGQSKVIGLVGDEFWFKLVQHPNVEKYYTQWSAMAELKDINPSEEFKFGDITFKRYEGDDTNSEVAIAVDEAKFFIQGGRDVFEKAMAPASEHMRYVNTNGMPQYVIPKYDTEYRGNERWMGFDVVSYPLYMCKRPNTLRTGTLT